MQVQATVSNSTFQGNSAGYGGALYLSAQTTTSIENCSFTANHASRSGGGIYLETGAVVTATECLFDKNNARYGGGLHCTNCSVQARRLSIIHTNAFQGGGLCGFDQAEVIG